MITRCLIVDDEPLAREGLEQYVQKMPGLELTGSCQSAIDALAFLQKEKPDLLFLDIQMPEMTGLELMKALPQPPKVIFTTAYREFAVEGFDLNAIDYLVKPISFERFARAVQKVQQRLDTEQTESLTAPADHIFIKSDGQIIKIPVSDIIYAESAKDYVFIHTPSKRYMALLPLKQLEENLPDDKFMRVHRSYLVATAAVDRLEGNLLYIGKTKVPISRSLHDEIYQKVIQGRLLER
ncbi:MAG: LytTR family DNA-binding domain-containing protein [Saprospiraceae bacterium]|nr:LytTR family DNA-binding domain-containing protein [Saprospiraceae bacterium]